jgi:RNA polymerase sigma-70 factor (ECF subfamily)
MASSDSQIAFEAIYRLYFQRLIRFVRLYVSSSAQWEEIVSDTFLAVWNNRKSLPDIHNFDSYIYSIARHKVISYYRSQRIDLVTLEEHSMDFFALTEASPEENLIKREEEQKLNAAINSLPNKCKMVFKLVREDKLKYKEVAEILDISVKTVEAHLSTAIHKLREALKE